MPQSRKTFNFEEETVASAMKRRNGAMTVSEPKSTRGEASSSKTKTSSQKVEEREPKGYTGTFEKMTAGVPVQYIEWFASTGKRKVNKSKDSKGKGVDREKKEKTDPCPPKKNTYADMSVPGGRLVRSSRKKESGKGTRTIELRNSGGILGW